MHYRLHNQNGVSMIEVLITLVVFSFGLLAVAGLQTLSKKSNFDAVQRTQASMLAMDMLERIRANPAAIDTYITANGTTTPSKLCDSAACNETELATWDVWQWNRQLSGFSELDTSQSGGGVDCSDNATTNVTCAVGGLAAPTGCITALGNNAYQVVIAWRGVTAQDEPAYAAEDTDPRKCGRDAPDPFDNTQFAYDDPDNSGNDNRMKRMVVMKAYF